MADPTQGIAPAATPYPIGIAPLQGIAPAHPMPAVAPPIAAPVALPTGVDPQMAAYFQKNQAWLKAGDHNYNSYLLPEQETAFRQWLSERGVPFDPNAHLTDYDMRGFWLALQRGDPVAHGAINPNDNQLHYPDYWKTPYDASFSAESQWADPAKAPRWNDQDQLVLPDGTIVYDERAVVKAGGRTG